jgi:hypothetical protein
MTLFVALTTKQLKGNPILMRQKQDGGYTNYTIRYKYRNMARNQ